MRQGLPAAGGGRWVDVAPERLTGWLDRFANRHGPVTWSGSPLAWTATASDGAVADCQVPFPPLRLDMGAHVREPGANPPGTGADDDSPGHRLAAHALVERRVGVLLVRLGGFAMGVFEGPRLAASKVGARQVHGRSAAGGRSQQRFARRRDGQVRVALGAAADAAAGVLLPAVAALDAVVLGGERRAAAQVLDDPRLAPLRGLVVDTFLTVPDPRRRVLDESPARFRAVRIRIVEPAPTDS